MSGASLRHGLTIMALGFAAGMPSAAAARKPVAPPPPPPATNPNAQEWSLINLTPADVQSASGGASVKVAVLDGLTDCRHSEFAGNPRRCENQQIEGGRYRFYDNHGTHVAGTVAGAKYGVATGANILNYAVFDDRFYVATGDKLINAWRDASRRGATISNMSFGCSQLALCFSAAEVSAMAGSDLASMLFVKAAGNDGVDLVNESIGVSADVAKAAMARTMLVGSVDVSGTISSFSNRPGDNCFLPTGAAGCAEDLKWKHYFIVAPGRDIYSALPGEGYGYMSGTSMASPVVSGAAALLRARWPSLKPEDAALILFGTAKDLGAAGVDNVYGWGLLDVGNAFSAQGNVTVVRPDGSTTTVAGTSLTGSPTMSRLAGVLGDVTVYDKYGRDFGFAESGALQLRPSLYPGRQLVAGRLLAQGGQQDWSSSFFASTHTPRGFLVYGSPGEIARSPLSPDRHARIGVDLPFKNGVAQLRMTGASATRADFAHDPSLKPLSFFASTALLDRSLLGHALVRVSGKSSLTFYAARSTDPLSPELEGDGREPYRSAERQVRLLGRASGEHEQEKSSFGFGFWTRPDSRTVIGLNGSVMAQSGGWYDISFHVPGAEAATRIANVGLLASRRIGDWEASVAGEISHLRTSGNGLFRFTPTTMASGEARLQRSGLLFTGATSDKLTFALSVPPRALAGSLDLEHMARTEDGLGRAPVSLRYPLARMGAESPKLEAAYRLQRASGWSLGVAGGVDLMGDEPSREVVAQMRVAF